MSDQEFQQELAQLLNRHGLDNRLNIPDFVLAEIIASQLNALETAQKQLDKWRNTDGKTKS